MKRLRYLLSGSAVLIALGYAGLANGQDYQWVKGTTTNLTTGKITKDNSGDILTSGTFIGDIDLDFSNVAADTAMLHGSGSFLAKYDAAGNYVWRYKLGNGSDTLVDIKAVQTDAVGNVYIAGLFKGVVDFNTGQAVADTAIETSLNLGEFFPCMYVAKYDAAGNFIWVMNLGGTLPELWDMKVKHNRLYLAGGITTYTDAPAGFKDVDFNPSKLPMDTFYLTGAPGTNEFDLNPFFAVYDIDATLITAKRINGSLGFKAYGIDADDERNIYLCGGLRGNHDLDPSLLPADTFSVNGSNGIFVASYDSSGIFRWAAPVLESDNWVGAFPDNPVLLKATSTGNIYVSGLFKGSVDFDPGMAAADTLFMTAGNAGSSYLVHYDATGAFLSAHSLKSNGEYDNIKVLDADDAGDVYIAGDFNGAIDFHFSEIPADTVILRSSGTGVNPDIFFAKYNNNDSLLYARKVGNAESQYLTGMAVANKSFSIFGTFGGDVVFNPMPPVDQSSKLLGGGTYLATYRSEPRSSAKQLLTYAFGTPAAAGTITATDSVLVTVPSGTDVATLTAVFTVSPDAIAKVGNTPQISGTTVNNFSNVLTYTIMAEDSSTRDYHVKVTVAESPTGIDEAGKGNVAFKVWPNPANNTLHFEQLADVKLYDINGKLVLSAVKVKELSITHLGAGMYILENELGQKRKVSIY